MRKFVVRLLVLIGMVTLCFLSNSIEFVREVNNNSYVRKFEVQLIYIYNSTIVRKYITRLTKKRQLLFDLKK